ncbi:MAG: WG repeat-containing protein [Alistipes sp.]|nr:WG repeat-containing protein [Alistipes sp.]
MRHLFTLLAILCISLPAFGEEYKIVQKGKKYGIRNSQGKWSVKPTFKKIDRYGENYAAEIHDKWSSEWILIDKNGNRITTSSYGSISPFYDDILKIEISGCDGLIRNNGNEVIPCKYDIILFFDRENGLAQVRSLDHKYGFIDKNGKEVIPCKYDYISYWEYDGLAKVKFNDKWGYINRNGNEIIPCRYNLIYDWENGLARVYLDSKWGYIDRNGNEIIPCKYDYISDWEYDGLAKVKFNDKWGYIDRAGNEIIPCRYYLIYDWVNGLAQVSFGNKWGYIDKKGNFYSTIKEAQKGTPTVGTSSSSAAAPVVKQVPILNIVANSLRFSDASGNTAIDANETCKITFKISNTGKGAGVGCIARVKTSAQGITVADKKLPTISAGQTITVEIPVTASQSTADGKADFRISIYEPNGFGCDPTTLTVATKAFVAPMLRITDYAVTGTENATIAKKQPFDLQLLLQNTAHGNAENVVVELKAPENVFITEGAQRFNTAIMRGGEKRTLSYSLIVNNNYTGSSVPLTVTVREKNGDRYAESQTITLPINQAIASSNRIVIDAKAETPQNDITIARIEDKVQPSDVDVNIPSATHVNTNTLAVIIANEKYDNVGAVEFALNDGTMFGEYCRRVLGIPEKNIAVYKNATYGKMRGAVNLLEELVAAYGGAADIVFYYVGHGIPDEKSSDAYLLPTDGMPADVGTCFSVDELYRRLGAMNARQVTIFTDACFSGARRDGSALVAARGVAIKVKSAAPHGKTIVFSAAQGDETAHPYREKRHGLFTYYLLKKLKETRGETTFGELADYVTRNVKIESLQTNKRSQTPSVSVAAELNDSWRNMKLKRVN